MSHPNPQSSQLPFPDAVPTLRLSAKGRLRALALQGLLGVGGVAAGWAALLPAAQADAPPPMGSPAWIAARGGSGARASGGLPRVSAGTGGLDATRGIGSVTTIAEATQRSARSVDNLARAAEAIADARSRQDAAAALAGAAAGAVGVPNGLVAGGLQVAAEVGTDPNLWVNAAMPVETREGAATRVTIEQTDRRAILTWDRFNIGAQTTLAIDQSAGTTTDGANDWVALNRVRGRSDGAQIHGRIEAEGSVYIIDNNGVLFGAGSEVDTHTLLATSLNLYNNDTAISDRTYLDGTQGLIDFVSAVPGNVQPPLLLVDPAEAGGAAGAIRVAEGATIATGRLGLAVLAAPEIEQRGTIRVNEGQAALLGARQVQLDADPGDDGRREVRLRPLTSVLVGEGPETRVINAGLIEATRGNVTLIAQDVRQDGVIVVRGGIATPGSIVMTDGTPGVASELGGIGPGRIRFGRDSLTAILPDGSGETTTSSDNADASFQPGRIELRAATVEFAERARLIAPGARLDIVAEGTPDQTSRYGVPGRVYIDGGAIIDLSGLANVTPLSPGSLVSVSRIGLNELANSPLQRSGFLFGQTNVLIDSRLQGVREDGTPWVASPVLNAEGVVDQTPRRLEELLIDAGEIHITGAQFIAREGAEIRLDGGWLNVPDATDIAARVEHDDGHIASIGATDPLRGVAGFAGRLAVIHRRWNVTSTYLDPIVGGHVARRLPAHIVGGDGGLLELTLTVGGPEAGNGIVVLDAGFSAQALAGREQVLAGVLPSGGALAIQTLAAATLRDRVEALADDFVADSQLVSGRLPQDRDNRAFWLQLSSEMLNAAGLSRVELEAAQVVVEAGAPLAFQPGATIAMTGARLDIGADLRTAGGEIRLTTRQGLAATTDITFVAPDSTAVPLTTDLRIADGVVLSARGRFVNDRYADPEAVNGAAFIDGGRIVLDVNQSDIRPLLSGIRGGEGDDAPVFGAAVDNTGNIVLGSGSRLDVGGGGYVDRDGQLRQTDFVPAGRGGDIRLSTYERISQQGAIGVLPAVQPQVGRILAADGDLRAHLDSHGFEGGGLLQLRALDLRIGGTSDPTFEGLLLAPDFFADQGFADYRLSSAWDAIFAPDTAVTVSRRNLLPDREAILLAATGEQPLAVGAATLGRLDDVRRGATNLDVTAADFVNANVFTRSNAPRDGRVRGTLLVDAGATITADPGSTIRLGSTNQLTVLGSLIAPGGAITLSGDTDPPTASGAVGLSPPDDPNAVVFADTRRSVWLGADSRLDVSGLALFDPLAPQISDADGNRRSLRSGRLLAGGTITLSNDSGYVIALDGAQLRADGATAAFELLGRSEVSGPNGRFVYRATDNNVWSDGGEIRIGAAGGLLFDASLSAAGGTAEARGGRFSLLALDSAPGSTRSPSDNPGEAEAVILFASARELILRQSGTAVPLGLLPGEEIEGGLPGLNGARLPSGTLLFSLDRLDDTGIDDVRFGQAPELRALSQPLTIAFAGSVDLAVAGRLDLLAHTYEAIPEGALTVPADPVDGSRRALGDLDVRLEAAYVTFGGTTFNSRRPLDAAIRANEARLEVIGRHGLDLVGNTALQTFASARFETRGDLRLLTPVGQNLTQDAVRTTPGSLFTSGDLTLAAAQIHPASNNRFQLVAAGPESRTIRFEQTAAAPERLPLSAGGQVLVSADVIEQAGTLRAPSGTLQLGVADPASAAAQAAFGGLAIAGPDGLLDASRTTLPLVATTTVRLEAGSETSVATSTLRIDPITGETRGAELVVPYGFTVDGRDLGYDAVFGSQAPASAALLDRAPEKRIVLDAAALDLADGAFVDLSGGGDLLAQEFVPGTGGSRDVLATVARLPGTSTDVSLFPDGRPVYAILPGYTAANGAYDPAIDARAEGPLVGQAVRLTDVPGLAPGDYVLLPARYATLPGALRLVQDTAAVDAVAVQNQRLPDGTLRVAGRFVDAYARLDGSIAGDGRQTLFLVQDGATWQQYSQYELTGANDYFQRIAADAGVAAALLPLDAGRLELGAGSDLNFAARVAAAGGSRERPQVGGGMVVERGASAQIDLAASAIQIVDAASTALDGFVQVSVAALDALDAASLLIGGSRSSSAAGTVIDTRATRVVVSSGAQQTLSAGELLLVARGETPAEGEARTAAIELADGAALAASGSAVIGASVLNLSGDGALLRIANGDALSVLRNGTSADGGSGDLRIGNGVQLGASRSADGSLVGSDRLLLDTSRDLELGDDLQFRVRELTASSGTIALVADRSAAAGRSGLVLDAATLDRLASVESLNLSAGGRLDFIGPLALDFGDTALTLAAGAFVGDGSTVRLDAERLTIAGRDSALAIDAPEAPAGRLEARLGELVFGAGASRIAGFAEVATTVAGRVLASGATALDFGSAEVAFTTPLVTANSGAALSLTTQGALRLDGGDASAAGLDPGSHGGRLRFDAASIALDTRLTAEAGSIRLATTAGALQVGALAALDVGGVERAFFDTAAAAAGGDIRLAAVGGDLAISDTARFALAGAGSGEGGLLSLSALDQRSAFVSTGVLVGGAASAGAGGRYQLDVGGAIALDAIAGALRASGLDTGIDIHARDGALQLAATEQLRAQTIRLTADAGSEAGAEAGRIVIAGLLDASGVKGGDIRLSAAREVAIDGRLLATGSAADERGGDIRIATDAQSSGIDGRFGHQQVTAADSGVIRFGSTAQVDVSGGEAGGLAGGVLGLRSALLDSGDINVTFDEATTVLGARAVEVEAYAVWSTRDGSGFDGTIDPAGNAGFYVNTLQGFLQQGELAFESRLGGIEAFVPRLGIELRTPDGGITVASTWNLGAATLDGNGNQLTQGYRHAGLAPIVTLRAAGDVALNASVSDGFVQLSNPLGLQAPRARSLEQVQAQYQQLLAAYPALAGQIEAPTAFGTETDPARAAQIAQYYGLYEQYLNYLLHGRLPLGALADRPITSAAPLTRIERLGIAAFALGAPVAPRQAQGYAAYLVDYDQYLDAREGGRFERSVPLPAAPRAELAPVFTGAALAGLGGVDNGASPMATAANPLPLAAASLAGGSSSSFRLVAGAVFDGADVFAVRATADAGGDVVLAGSSSWRDPVTGATVLVPTMLRTGTGSIEIAAARDFLLADPLSPGVVYTAGAPRADGAAETASRILQPALYAGSRGTPLQPALVAQSVVSGFVQPDGAGDLAIAVGRDIVGQQSAYAPDSTAGQYWWSWLDTGNDVVLSLDDAHNGSNGLVAGGIADVVASSINFGSFGQGLMSVGGDVQLDAGRDVANLQVSLPVTWSRAVGDDGSPSLRTHGGGDLSLRAGGDLRGGSVFVADGDGRLRVDGRIGSGMAGFDPILATQLGRVDVAARREVAIAGLYNPAYLPGNLPAPLFVSNSLGYGEDSRIAIRAETGDLRFGTLATEQANGAFAVGATSLRLGEVLPASLALTALDGSLNLLKAGSLAPSASGNLDLLAADTIRFTSAAPIRITLENVERRNDRYFGMIDAAPETLPNAFNVLTARSPDFQPPALRLAYRFVSAAPSTVLHAESALHAADFTPSRVYALGGDIIGGRLDDDGLLRDALVLAPNEATFVRAGRDVVNLSFMGQQVRNADVTRIEAGRDLFHTVGGIDQSIDGALAFGSEPSMLLAGPGEFQIVAGRDVGPFVNQNQIIDGRSRPADINETVPRDVGSAPLTGINAIGNLYNPFLPRDGAAVSVSFGVGPGRDDLGFLDFYVNPLRVPGPRLTIPGVEGRPDIEVELTVIAPGRAVGGANGEVDGQPAYFRYLPSTDYGARLVAFIQQYEAGLVVNTGRVDDVRPLPPAKPVEEAYAQLLSLPAVVRERFVNDVFFDLLRQTGTDFGDPTSAFFRQYARGYQAVDTLFPAALGYTANNLSAQPEQMFGTDAEGKPVLLRESIGNGAFVDAAGRPVLASTGDLDLRGTTIQTQQGGTISLFGPGGEALLGSTSAPPFATDAQGRLFAGPGTQGILSLEQGEIRSFTDRSLLLAQSRVFTEQGGDILIWSSNADINAGRGARTTAELPLPAYTCNLDFYCLVDNRGAVSGAGIATLQTIVGAPPGDILLLAPAGTVDLGDAGLRSSGNLIIAAQRVANAANASVAGTAVGLNVATVDAGALTAGSSAAAAATQQATRLAAQPVSRAENVITVEVQGFGSPDDATRRALGN